MSNEAIFGRPIGIYLHELIYVRALCLVFSLSEGGESRLVCCLMQRERGQGEEGRVKIRRVEWVTGHVLLGSTIRQFL